MSSTVEVCVSNGDGDDYVEQGAAAAERYANSNQGGGVTPDAEPSRATEREPSNVVSVNRGIARFAVGTMLDRVSGRRHNRHQVVAPMSGYVSVRHAVPRIISGEPPIAPPV